MDTAWTLGILLLLAVVRGSLSKVTPNGILPSLDPSLLPPVDVHVCHKNSDCGFGFCCVTADGDTLAEGSMYNLGPAMTGTCKHHVIQEQGACDYHSGCLCGAGLTCYRQVGGICCPPMRCRNSTWVQHEKEYWANCLMSAHCGFPP